MRSRRGTSDRSGSSVTLHSHHWCGTAVVELADKSSRAGMDTPFDPKTRQSICAFSRSTRFGVQLNYIRKIIVSAQNARCVRYSAA